MYYRPINLYTISMHIILPRKCIKEKEYKQSKVTDL